jgi:FADH2 O2-dependent halogenase
MEQHRDASRFGTELAAYAKQTDDELLATARLIGCLYASMGNFPLFTSLSLLYFATASFAEAARRLGKPHLASSFLLHDHPSLRTIPDLMKRGQSVRGARGTEKLNEDILRVIEPFNVAGLGRPERRNWYPVEAEDLLRGAPKLEADREEIGILLDRCGFR